MGHRLDNADFTHLLSIFEFNVAPDATEQDGIPAGIYTITEDYAPNTVTWATYDEEMTYLSTGTVTVERDGEEYKVTVDAVDEYDAPSRPISQDRSTTKTPPSRPRSHPARSTWSATARKTD